RYYESLSRVFATREAPMAHAFESVVMRMHELAGAAERLPLDHAVYYLKVFDNYHYMDEDEVYWRGPFFGKEAALSAARGIVDRGASKGGGEAALREYRSFGKDPVIVGSPAIEFSAWDYASLRCGDRG